MKEMIKKYLSNKKLKKIGKAGKNCYIDKGVYIKNPQYLSIGESCYFGHDCRIEAWDSYLDDFFSPIIKIGNNVKINSNCHIGAIDMIEIGNDCLLGSNVMIIDHSHGETNFDNSKIHPSKRKLYSKGKIIIEDRCWLAENVVILPGVTIGEGSIIGANAVVTKNIPQYSVAVGNPAKVVKTICREE